MKKLIDVLSKMPVRIGKPTCIIAHTVKGKGVSYIENNKFWHHKVPTPQQLNDATKELNLTKEGIENERE